MNIKKYTYIVVPIILLHRTNPKHRYHEQAKQTRPKKNKPYRG